MYTWKINKWTSELIISADIEIDDVIKKNVLDILDYIETYLSKWGNGQGKDPEYYLSEKLIRYGLNGDLTCMLKGLAIDKISRILSYKFNSSHFVISFGGDIYTNGVPIRVAIDGTDFFIESNSRCSIFTSGNTEKRGNHIIGGIQGHQHTVIVNWSKNSISNTLVDILATKSLANETQSVDELTDIFLRGESIKILKFDGEKLLNQTYTASPFFNPIQIEIRDKMVSRFINTFRPDLTDSAKKYDGEGGDDSLVSAVVRDNIIGISESNHLVFPCHTTDLGTLFEVGVAIGINATVIRYNELSDSYTVLACNPDLSYGDNLNQYPLFDLSDKRSAIMMGYVSAKYNEPKNMLYELKGYPDNIMMSVNHTHVEK